jgi:hypothetical protein
LTRCENFGLCYISQSFTIAQISTVYPRFEPF